MALQFPTMAERALIEFRDNGAKSVQAAVNRIAKGVHVTRSWPSIVEYHFDDDTTLRVSGRGQAHSIEALLP